jgi:hypothetical protein
MTEEDGLGGLMAGAAAAPAIGVDAGAEASSRLIGGAGGARRVGVATAGASSQDSI